LPWAHGCDAFELVARDLDATASQVRLLLEAAALLEHEHGLKPPKRLRDWRKPGQMEVNEFLRSVARDLKEELIEALALRWQELRPIQLVWEELALEFGGADPVDPQFREKLAAASGQIASLAGEFGATGRLAGPDDSLVSEARKVADDAFERLEPLL